MKIFATEKRKSKIEAVLSSRQKSLTVVLENIHDPHNVSAIFSTCDAVGVGKVSLLYWIEKFPKIGKKSSASAFKWVDKTKYTTPEECIRDLKKDDFLVYASSLDEGSVSFYDLDMTGKVAIVLGNEHRGVSEETAKLADKKFLIPMRGMVQSLNVSVAAAVILYEAQRQRNLKNMYPSKELTEEELEENIKIWCKK